MTLYHTTDPDGVSEISPSKDRLQELVRSLDSMDAHDPDHPDIALVHDASGWSLSLFPSGIAVWENLDGDDTDARHLRDVPRDKALDLWLKLSRGEIDAIEQEPWETD